MNPVNPILNSVPNPDDDNNVNKNPIPDSVTPNSNINFDATYSDEMNQYLNDAVADINASSVPPKQPVEEYPTDPYGLGGSDDFSEPINLDDLSAMGGLIEDGLSSDDSNAEYDANAYGTADYTDANSGYDTYQDANAGYNDGYSQDAYADQGYTQDGYTDQGYTQDGYSDQGYSDPNAGYDANAYGTADYTDANNGYDTYQDPNAGYNDGYTQDGYTDQGYTQDGYSDQGYSDPNAGYDANAYGSTDYTDVNNGYGTYQDPNAGYNDGYSQDTYANQGYTDPNAGYQSADYGSYNNSSFEQPDFSTPNTNSTPNTVNTIPNTYSEPDLGGKVPKSAKKKTKKKKGGVGKFFLFLFILLLLGGGGAFGYYYYINYFQVTANPKQAFFESLGKTNIEDVFKNNIAEIASKVVSTSHASSIEATASSTLEDLNTDSFDISKGKVNVDYIIDKTNEEYSADVKVSYSDNDIYKLNLVQTADTYAEKVDGLTEKYVGTSLEKLADSNRRYYGVFNWKNLIISANPSVSAKESETVVEKLDVDNKFVSEKTQKYIETFANEFSDESFESVTNVKLEGLDATVSGAKLKTTQEQILKAYIEVVKAIREDDELINAIASDGVDDNTLDSTSKKEVQEESNTTADEVPVSNPEENTNNVEVPTQNAAAENTTAENTTTNSAEPTNTAAEPNATNTTVENTTTNNTEQTQEPNATPTENTPATTTEEVVPTAKLVRGVESTKAANANDLALSESSSLEVPLVSDSSSSNLGIDLDASVDVDNNMDVLIIASLLTKVKLPYTVEEIEDALDSRIKDLEQEDPESKDYEIASYVANGNTQRITIESDTTNIEIDFIYGNDKQSIKITHLDKELNNLDSKAEGLIPDSLVESVMPSNSTGSSSTNGVSSNLNAALESSNTADMSDATISSEVLTTTSEVDVEDEDEDSEDIAPSTTKSSSSSTKSGSSSIDSGYSLTIENSSTDVATKYNIELDIIDKKEINNKFKVSITSNGTASSKEIKNVINLTYSNKDGNASAKISYNVNFDLGDKKVTKLTNDNCVFLDKMTDAEVETLKTEVTNNQSKLDNQVQSDVNLADEHNTNTQVETPPAPTTPENTISLEDAQATLITAISDYMGEVINRGEEFTLEKLKDLKIEGHEYSAVVSGEIAIIEMDGHRFHLDSAWALSSEY